MHKSGDFSTWKLNRFFRRMFFVCVFLLCFFQHLSNVNIAWAQSSNLGSVASMPIVGEPGEEPVGNTNNSSQPETLFPAVSSEPTFLELNKLAIPPYNSEASFTEFMVTNRKEDLKFLEERYDRWRGLIRNKDISREKETLAFLMTPREKFCRSWNLKRAYEHAFLDIHYGVTISGPYLVGRMTGALDVKPGDKVLEIGTGSGYQSAFLAYLTDKVYTIEIIEALASETDQIYRDLSASGHPEFNHIKRKADDGYYGWEENGPYDKIVVTCGIDHIPPPLLQQLKVGGIMVIPVGPPGAQFVLKVSKVLDEEGDVTVTREDIYKGRKKVPFVPFTKKGGGTHFQK